MKGNPRPHLHNGWILISQEPGEREEKLVRDLSSVEEARKICPLTKKKGRSKTKKKGKSSAGAVPITSHTLRTGGLGHARKAWIRQKKKGGT